VNGKLINAMFAKKAIEVAGNNDREGQNIQIGLSNSNYSQKWFIVYVGSEDDKPTPKKGDYVQDFGFYALRPFYLESQAKDGRFMTNTGSGRQISEPKLAERSGEETQMYYFDPNTNTIKSVQFDKIFGKERSYNRALEIRADGT
jgi:hypothetical protein